MIKSQFKNLFMYAPIMSTREQICHLAEQHLRRRGTNICNMNKFFDMLETFFLFALFLQFFFSTLSFVPIYFINDDNIQIHWLISLESQFQIKTESKQAFIEFIMKIEIS